MDSIALFESEGLAGFIGGYTRVESPLDEAARNRIRRAVAANLNALDRDERRILTDSLRVLLDRHSRTAALDAQIAAALPGVRARLENRSEAERRVDLTAVKRFVERWTRIAVEVEDTRVSELLTAVVAGEILSPGTFELYHLTRLADIDPVAVGSIRLALSLACNGHLLLWDQALLEHYTREGFDEVQRRRLEGLGLLEVGSRSLPIDAARNLEWPGERMFLDVDPELVLKSGRALLFTEPMRRLALVYEVEPRSRFFTDLERWLTGDCPWTRRQRRGSRGGFEESDSGLISGVADVIGSGRFATVERDRAKTPMRQGSSLGTRQRTPAKRDLTDSGGFSTKPPTGLLGASEASAPLGMKRERSGLHTMPAKHELEGRDLRGQDRRGDDLRGANLRSANLEGADLRSANLENAALDAARICAAKLRGTNLRHAVLERADLRKSDLRLADLDGADLRHARLDGAVLHGANLRNADLRKASLRGCKLTSCDLTGARLDGADLTDASLIRSNLASATVVGTILMRTIYPDGSQSIANDGGLAAHLTSPGGRLG